MAKINDIKSTIAAMAQRNNLPEYGTGEETGRTAYAPTGAETVH